MRLLLTTNPRNDLVLLNPSTAQKVYDTCHKEYGGGQVCTSLRDSSKRMVMLVGDRALYYAYPSDS